MRVEVGTSGYSYKEWKGAFYPAKLPDKEMLRFYATQLRTVEINNTFYRMPTESLVQGWAKEAPEGFLFSLKAPQRITHQKRLKDAKQSVDEFVHVAGALGAKMGPLIFQLPPFFKKDAPRLKDFLALFPSGVRVAFEFRNESWFDDEVFEILRTYRTALCSAESDELASPVVATTDWGYMRLRRTDYTDAEIDAWAGKILAQKWDTAFVYMKHDDGNAPALAKKLVERLAAQTKA